MGATFTYRPLSRTTAELIASFDAEHENAASYIFRDLESTYDVHEIDPLTNGFFLSLNHIPKQTHRDLSAVVKKDLKHLMGLFESKHVPWSYHEDPRAIVDFELRPSMGRSPSSLYVDLFAVPQEDWELIAMPLGMMIGAEGELSGEGYRFPLSAERAGPGLIQELKMKIRESVQAVFPRTVVHARYAVGSDARTVDDFLQTL